MRKIVCFITFALSTLLFVQCGKSDKIYQIGDYYNANGKKGIVVDVWNGGRNGKIISLERSRQQWCTETMANQRRRTAATSTTDGSLNTAFILSRPDKHEFPAFMWCESLGEGWYLPAIGELCDMSRKKAIIGPAFRKYDKNYDSETYIFEDFWSSTDCSAHWSYAPLNSGNSTFDDDTYEEYCGPYSNYAEWMYIQEDFDPLGWEPPYKTDEAGVRAMAYF